MAMAFSHQITSQGIQILLGGISIYFIHNLQTLFLNRPGPASIDAPSIHPGIRSGKDVHRPTRSNATHKNFLAAFVLLSTSSTSSLPSRQSNQSSQQRLEETNTTSAHKPRIAHSSKLMLQIFLHPPLPPLACILPFCQINSLLASTTSQSNPILYQFLEAEIEGLFT
jgi:hypothetical protein